MRTRSLLDAANIPPRRLDPYIRRGDLFRPRNGWIAVPEADPMLVAAAETGVVLTCVTQAARLGLWQVDDGRVHVGIAPDRHTRRATDALLHWRVPPTPRDPASLTDPLDNVLALIAECQPYEDALAVWESALRTGQADAGSLTMLATTERSRRLARDAAPYSDAGTESVILARLRWLRIPLRRQVWLLGHRVDLLLGDRLVIQVDGGHHVGAQRASDVAHDARLLAAGFHVIRITVWQLHHEWPAVQERIQAAIARGLHLARV